MPIPLPLKWMQAVYRLTMLFGKKRRMQLLPPTEPLTSIYDIKVVDIDGHETDLSVYRGKFMLIVNVASECGYTPQYSDLQLLSEEYGDKLAVLGFPSNDFGEQEPAAEKEIKFFCTENYHITFPMFSKIHVAGLNKHPVYKWLSEARQNGWNNEEPSWNFCKYLVDDKGRLLSFFSKTVNPYDREITGKL
jgi:glutathione peroxidase